MVTISTLLATSVVAAAAILGIFRKVPRDLTVAVAIIAVMAMLPNEATLSGPWVAVFVGTVSLMVLAGVVRRSGLMSWVAIRLAKAVRGRPKPLLWWLAILAFVTGLGLGPVAAVALVLPVALLLATELQLPPVPFVMTTSVSGLWGSTISLASSPGMIWLSSLWHWTAAEWALQMAPWALGGAFLFLVITTLVFWPKLRATNERRARLLEFEEARSLTSRLLAGAVVVVGVGTLAGLFLLPAPFNQPALLLSAAALVLVVVERPPANPGIWSELEVSTVLFWAGWAFLATQPFFVEQLKAFEALLGHPSVVLTLGTVLGTLWEPLLAAGVLGSVIPPMMAVPLVLATALGGVISPWSSQATTVSRSLVSPTDRTGVTRPQTLVGLGCWVLLAGTAGFLTWVQLVR